MKIFRKISLAVVSLLATAASAVAGFLSLVLTGGAMPRLITHDVAFGFRMGAGFPGDVNRTHPFSVEPSMLDTVAPPVAYGVPLLYKQSNNSYKGFVITDTVTPIICGGFLVRPYPTQQASGGMNAAFGAGVPAAGIGDVLNSGYIMSKIPAGVVVRKNDAVYVWFAATSGNNIQGQLVGAATGGSTALITNAKFNGPADADGNVEIRVWQQG